VRRLSQPQVSGRIFAKQIAVADVAPDRHHAAVAGLAHDGAFGFAGGGGRSGQAGAQAVAGERRRTATLGWIYYKKQVYKTALDYWKDSVAKDQKNATFQYELGMIYWKLGDTAQARRSLSAALTLDPHSTSAAMAREALASF
jgi:Tfp pilus assembly protein PilF